MSPKSHLKMPRISRTQFNKGDQVEVLKRDNNDPTTLVYYPASVLRSTALSFKKNHILIQYQTPTVESHGSKPIKELVDLAYVRPTPPRQPNECFKVNDNVDVYCDDGWHKGIVKDILENSKYVVGFDGKSEGILAEQCSLRLHREWDDGSWVPPLLQQVCHVLYVSIIN